MSSPSALQAFHPQVSELLRAMTPQEGGAVLAPDDLARTARALRDHDERQVIAVQLIALAKRFIDARCPNTATQLVFLAVAAVGAGVTQAQLAATGVDPTAAKALLAQAEVLPPHLGVGLAAPSSSATTLRVPRRR